MPRPPAVRRAGRHPRDHARLNAALATAQGALGEARGHWLSRDERTLLRRDVDLAIEEAVRRYLQDNHRDRLLAPEGTPPRPETGGNA